MPAPLAKTSQLTVMGLALEAAYGTGLTPTKFVPVKTHDYKPNVQRILNEGKRGVNAKDFGALAGHRWAEMGYGGDFFPDVPPYFLYGVLGAKSVTGSGPTYTHSFTLGSSIPSFTIYDDYVANKRQMPGALVEEFSIKWGTTETTAISWDAKLRSNVGATVSAATPSIGSTAPWLGWQYALTVNGSAVTRGLNGSLTIKRPVEQLWGGANTQDPNDYAAGPAEVTGTLGFYMTDDSDLSRVETLSLAPVVATFTSGTNILTLTMTACDYEAVSIDRSGTYVKVEATIRGHYNATDGGPIKVTVQNAVASYA